MRLINTTTLALEVFQGLTPEYAILSHTWGDEEVTWLDNLGLHETRFGFWKILKACFQARRDGLAWLWVDTGCIDKTSSAELSEAINSMYAWYLNSTVCYAYLADVPDASPNSPRFRSSRWFTRGWTLQELLAPSEVVFYSRDWVQIGTKKSLAKLVYEITGIREEYLLQMDGILGASIAQRMSWVSNRSTTRPEDMAYCLLGLFDVNLPLIYGEGSKAFVRLQEEIIKVSDDHSIFAWNWITQLSDPFMRGGKRHKTLKSPVRTDKPYRPSLPSSKSYLSSGGEMNGLGNQRSRFPEFRLECLRRDARWKDPRRPTLLAPDPIAFYDSGTLPVLMPSSTVAPFTLTNAGLSISLPIIRHVGDNMIFAVLDRRQDQASGSQTLLCVPLVRHTQHRNRYVRTWFPAGPVELVRDIGESYPSETIEVGRDIQMVPFYYPSFGGTSHRYGFWVILRYGADTVRLYGGITTSGGVFNNYGIFFDRDEASKNQLLSGLLIFDNQHPTDVFVLFLALRFQSSKNDASLELPTYYCTAVRRKRRLLTADGDIANLYHGLGRDCRPVRLDRQVPKSLSHEGISARLLNNVPLSHCSGSDIKLVDVNFT
ncbi:HET-domain-containing protein [Thozetella sp. PMI_491]|nr:HET-domain-containing protein [Thozetella sp. PMI_491]